MTDDNIAQRHRHGQAWRREHEPLPDRRPDWIAALPWLLALAAFGAFLAWVGGA